MKKYTAFLVLLLILGLSGIATAAEPSSGVIEGQVVNGTEGGGNVANQNVTLETYINNAKQEDTRSTQTDAEGKFQFADLSTDASYSYIVSIHYQAADYYSEPVVFDDGETSKSIEITVFESTENDEAIAIPLAHTIIYAGQGELLVKEYLLFGNGSDRTYVGAREIGSDGKRETLRFPLPDGATGLQPTLGLMQCCIFGGEGGFVDTMPVQPGMKEVAYSYTIKADSGSYSLSKKIDYPVASFDLLVQGEGLEVTSDQLTKGDPIDIQGKQFSRLTAKDLDAGTTLEIYLSGLPNTGGLGLVRWVVIILIACAHILALGYIIRRRRRRQSAPSEVMDYTDSPDQEKQRLLLELANLDDEFEEGNILEEAYQQMRAEKKAQLVELTRKAGEGNL